ncbi:MAG: hypothetical protein ACXWXS_06660, partial [Actinomycetota bacterium]
RRRSVRTRGQIDATPVQVSPVPAFTARARNVSRPGVVFASSRTSKEPLVAASDHVEYERGHGREALGVAGEQPLIDTALHQPGGQLRELPSLIERLLVGETPDDEEPRGGARVRAGTPRSANARTGLATESEERRTRGWYARGAPDPDRLTLSRSARVPRSSFSCAGRGAHVE